ncbi:DUF3846 domain-containing protein [Actinoplanes sp. NPDC049802]|uniref:DUF3846 domain-containing protein n=1 Tax=Actinoplanes sp. NPDC049802 TaxID=3154742 RepID=UPI003403112F
MAKADNRQVRVVIIPTGATEPIQDTRISGASLGTVVGGTAGLLSLPGTTAQLYCNDNGRQLQLPPNPRATRFVTHFIPHFARADMILGPAVIIGVGDDGYEGDIPDDVADLALDIR